VGPAHVQPPPAPTARAYRKHDKRRHFQGHLRSKYSSVLASSTPPFQTRPLSYQKRSHHYGANYFAPKRHPLERQDRSSHPGMSTGSFTLSDTVAPAKIPTLRTVSFSGILRQAPSDVSNVPFGSGFFLLPSLPAPSVPNSPQASFASSALSRNVNTTRFPAHPLPATFHEPSPLPFVCFLLLCLLGSAHSWALDGRLVGT